MKTKILSIIALAATAFSFVACDDHGFMNSDNQKGSLSFAGFGVEVDPSEAVKEDAGAGSRAAADVSDFIVKINDAKGAAVYNAKYGELPDVVELASGDYTIDVISHNVEKAAWEKPYYCGSQKFSITKDRITDIGTIVCKFSSIRVTVRFTKELRELLGNDVFVRVVANDNGELVFTRDETRSGYFEAVEGSSTLIATLTGTIMGQSFSKTVPLTDVKAGHHRIITFGIKGPTPPEETGTIDPTTGIRLDVDVTDVDCDGNVNVDEDVIGGDDSPWGPEQPDDPDPDDPNPPVPSEGKIEITSDDLVLGDAGRNSPTAQSHIVNMYVEKGIDKLMVRIKSSNSDFLASAGEMMPLEFDLANLTATLGAEVAGTLTDPAIGLPADDQVKGQTNVVFNISGLAPLLAVFPGTHTFEFELTDAAGNSKSEKLIYIAE